MSYYVFLHFKSDIVPHPTPSPLPHPILLSLCFQSWTYFYLPPSLVCLLPTSLNSMVFYLFSFPSPFPVISMTSFALAMLCFHFVFPLLFPLLFFSAPTRRSCQSLCVLGRCCGCRQPALSRRPSTRQGRGVRIRCSQGIDCMLCPGPPIAQTCCMNMLPGRTSNRAEPPPATSESSSHSLDWPNIISTWLIYWHRMLGCEAMPLRW